MKESVGYTVTLNIIIVFIVVTFAFLGFALIYYKANRVTNIITHSIEKYEGYNSCSENFGCAEEEIIRKLSSIGYNMKKINCSDEIKTKSNGEEKTCDLVSLTNGSDNGTSYANGDKGYCIYLCLEGDYYYYKIRTNMFLDIPIVSAIDLPIYTNTNRMYNYEELFGTYDPNEQVYSNSIKPATEATRTLGNVPQGEFKPGDEYIIEVSPGKNYTFFVLSTNGDKVNLIMDSNISSDGMSIKDPYPKEKGLVAWVSSQDYSVAGKAMAYLNDATAGWNNIPSLNETYTDEGAKYGTMKLTGKARLPKESELIGAGCNYDDNSCPLWLLNYLVRDDLAPCPNPIPGIVGYWTFSSDAYLSSGELASVVHYSGGVRDYYVYIRGSFGVRPVITISKSYF